MNKRSFSLVWFFSLFWIFHLFSQTTLTDQLNRLLQKEAVLQVLSDSLTQLQNTEGSASSMTESNTALSRLTKALNKVRSEILQIKAVVYDTQQSQAVWADGAAEITLDENKPFEQSKRLLLMYARRDAMEKGGQLIIETMTEMRKSELTSLENDQIQSRYQEEFKSIIRSKGKVQVIEQDESGDYGKVFTIEEDGHKKIKVKLRLKMIPIDNFNPFREELQNIDQK